MFTYACHQSLEPFKVASKGGSLCIINFRNAVVYVVYLCGFHTRQDFRMGETWFQSAGDSPSRCLGKIKTHPAKGDKHLGSFSHGGSASHHGCSVLSQGHPCLDDNWGYPHDFGNLNFTTSRHLKLLFHPILEFVVCQKASLRCCHLRPSCGLTMHPQEAPWNPWNPKIERIQNEHDTAYSMTTWKNHQTTSCDLSCLTVLGVALHKHRRVTPLGRSVHGRAHLGIFGVIVIGHGPPDILAGWSCRC